MSLLTEGTSSAERRRREEIKDAILRLLDELTSAGQAVRYGEVAKQLSEGASVAVEQADFSETMRALEMEGLIMISGEGARRNVRRVTAVVLGWDLEIDMGVDGVAKLFLILDPRIDTFMTEASDV
ncbi:hypothetical protein HYQ45_008790 [Verticillium longisporum]|nr:hypothetical protein HYQ45_008790 [Verticillium longisporum]